jgi:hypothetical protein
MFRDFNELENYVAENAIDFIDFVYTDLFGG